MKNVGSLFMRLAVTWFVAGVTLGIVMAASHNHSMFPVHAHINLLGWATMALAGLIYCVFPQAGASRLAKVHFWLINLAMPVMLVSLSMLLLGNPAVEPVLACSEIVAAVAIASFAANIYLNVGKTEQSEAAEPAYAAATSAAN